MNTIEAHLPDTPPSTLPSRVFARWRVKLLMLVGLVPLFEFCYLLPQHVPFRAPATLPLTWIDRAIPFQPAWVYSYLSLYAMLLIPPILATHTDQLRRYTVGVAIMFAVATAIFFLWPVEYPRPPLPDLPPASYLLLATIDRPVNSIPSLHAGLIAYTLFFAARALSDLPAPTRRALLITLTLWSAAILYATLATKQHYLLDLPPGVLLAYLAHRLAWRSPTHAESERSAAADPMNLADAR